MTTIILEPNLISSAYRPVVFDVSFPDNPPVTYCDIYINNIYCKTLSKTFPDRENIYRFDIADTCQEVLSSELAPINSGTFNVPKNHFLECFCKFRSSKIDTNGFIKQEEKVPVQATSSNPAQAGGGIQSDYFFVINAVLQHENNQNIVEHLKAFHNYGNDVLVLSHRPENYKICKNSSDFLSVFTNANLKCIKVTVKRNDGSTSVYQKCNSWIGVNMVCLKNSNGQNTGYKNYTTLEMYDWNNQPTGVTKSNTSGTEGYIDPVYDDVSCPLQSEPTTCDAPIINSVTVNNDGKFVIDYIVTTTNLSTPEYQVSTTPDFTTIIHYRAGFAYTNPETTALSQAGYTSLYFRARKHCSNPQSSNWSNVLHWINQNQSSPGYDFNPVNCIPGDYQTPRYYNPQGTNNYSICTTGNQFTKNLKIDTATPQAGTQLLLMDGVTKAIPGNLSSFDGTNGGNGTNFNLYGIRWVRFINGAYAYKVYDVESSTGKIIGESQTFNCN